MRSAFEAGGDIRGVDLLASLTSLWRERASGSLRFSRSGATAGFEILDGAVVASLSSQGQFDVAAILARAGKLDPAAVERLGKPEGGGSAIAALQAGLISGKEWRWSQKIRAMEILSDVLAWLEGEYEWDSAAVPSPGDWSLPIPRLVLELFLRSRDRTLVEHYLGPPDLPLVRGDRFDEEFQSFGLTADAGSVVRLIDGRASAEEIAGKAPAEEFAVLKLLAALTTLGLVHPAEAAPGGPPPRKKKRGERRAGDAARPAPSPPRAPLPPVEPEPETAPPPAPPEGHEAESAEAVGQVREPLAEEPEPEKVPEPELPADRPEPSPNALPVLSFAPQGETDEEIPLRREHSLLDEEPAHPIDREFRMAPALSSEPPPVAGRRGPGALLTALLAVLAIAVATLLVLRSRSRGPRELAVATTPSPSPQELPVFPPAETAIPLPRRGKAGATPSATAAPSRTATAAPVAAAPPTAAPKRVEPTRRPTPAPTRPVPTKTATATATRPAPSKSPTARPTSPAPTRTMTPTRPAPTKTTTMTPTKTPTRTATKTLTPVPTRPAPTKTPTLVPTRPAPTRTRTPAPVPLTPTRRPPAAPTRPAATRSPAPTPSPAPFNPEAAAARTDWIRRAERDRQALSRRRDSRYAVQLELACEVETLQKAWAWDKPPGTMWLLSTSYRGRTCFRVLWGHYRTLADAQAARARVPAFFNSGGNRPTPVLVR